MRRIKILLYVSLVVLISVFMAACNKKVDVSDEALKICGSWAYNHDKDTPVAVFEKNGKAKYENKTYTYECDSQFITLKDTLGETIKIRYVLDDEGMYLYSNNTYTYCGDGEPNGLIGEWKCTEKNWSYYFSNKGTFMEDGLFTGYYIVNDQNSTFKLIYVDQFEDTVCYFHLDGNQLQVEYPWRLVKTKAN